MRLMSGSVSEVKDGLHGLDEDVATSDLNVKLLSNIADARPAVLFGAQQVLDTVDVCSLVLTLLLGSILALLNS